MERIYQVCAQKGLTMIQYIQSSSNARLLVSDKGFRRSTPLDKRFKYLTKCFSIFLTCNAESKRYNFIITVNSSKDSNNILPFLRTYVLNQIICQIITYSLSIKFEIFLHSRTNCNKYLRYFAFRNGKSIHTDIIIMFFELFDNICNC